MQGSHLISQTPAQKKYGPDYGLEAIRRLEAGYPIVYAGDDGVLTEEYPDGRRFEITVDVAANDTVRNVRELTPAPRYYVPPQALTDREPAH